MQSIQRTESIGPNVIVQSAAAVIENVAGVKKPTTGSPRAAFRKFAAENNQQLKNVNFSGPLKLAGNKEIPNLNRIVLQAMRVEYAMWNGAMSHIGYYPGGMIVTTINGMNMQQYCYQNGVLVGTSNIWSSEVINGIECFVHYYPDGSIVCSSDFQQVVIGP